MQVKTIEHALLAPFSWRFVGFMPHQLHKIAKSRNSFVVTFNGLSSKPLHSQWWFKSDGGLDKKTCQKTRGVTVVYILYLHLGVRNNAPQTR